MARRAQTSPGPERQATMSVSAGCCPDMLLFAIMSSVDGEVDGEGTRVAVVVGVK